MEWISVDERLPEKDTKVLVCHSYGATTGMFDGEFWHSIVQPKKNLTTVTHWLEIPELPLSKSKAKRIEREQRKKEVKQYPENLLCAIIGERNIEAIGFNSDMSIVGERLEKMLDTLLPREKEILHIRWKNRFSFQTVAEMYNLTKERIRQIENKALRKLRHPTRWAFIKDGIDIKAEKIKALELAKAKKEQKIQDFQFEKIEIEHLDFSVRAFNCLSRAGYRTLKDLLLATDEDLRNIRNAGPHTVNEVKNKIAPYRKECEQ